MFFRATVTRAIFPAMPDSANPPQFDTAEYVGTPGENRCRFCKQPIADRYYRVGLEMACGSCAEMARRHQPKDSHAAFVRAVVLGIGAAIVGMTLYAGIVILLHGITVGYFSLAVGYIVGKGMMMGSKGLGGRKYQIVAVLLTYAAVSTAAIPIWYYQLSREHHPKTTQEQLQDEQHQFEQESGQQSAPVEKPRPSVGAVIVTLLGLGLASPFLEVAASPGWGLVGLVILFVGLQIAWKMTQGRPALGVEGPFDVSAPKPA